MNLHEKIIQIGARINLVLHGNSRYNHCCCFEIGFIRKKVVEKNTRSPRMFVYSLDIIKMLHNIIKSNPHQIITLPFRTYTLEVIHGLFQTSYDLFLALSLLSF